MSELAVVPSEQLRVILTNNGLEEERAVLIAEKFNEFFLQGNEWAEKAKVLSVTSVEQVNEMKQAREGRLFLKQRRVGIENLRKTLKERSLTEGRAIDLIAKHLTSLVEPTERYLEQQETFPIREKARLRRELIDSRRAKLAEYPGNDTDQDLATMNEQEFVDLLNKRFTEWSQEQTRKQQQEQQQKHDAQEAARLRAQNERLQKELNRERGLKETATKAIDELLEERKKQEHKDLQAQQQERDNELASDREKLTKLASSLARAAIPHVESREAADILDRVEQMLTEIETFIQREAAKL